MSLILLSNDTDLTGGQSVGIAQANQWSNTTQHPLVIGADSEVALQSLKVNRTLGPIVSDNNNEGYLYIGAGRSNTLREEDDPRLVAPFTLEPKGLVSAESFVDNVLLPSLRKAVFHADYQDRINGSVNEDSATGSFRGYNIKFGEGDTPPTSQLPAAFVVADDGTNDFTYNATTGVITKGTATATRAYGIATELPMSQRKAKHVVDFSGAGTSWAYGLSRYASATDPVPEWGSPIEKDWFDFGVAEIDGKLEIYHTVIADIDNPVLEPKEVVYYGYTGALVTERYDLATNASAYDQLEFFVDGNQINVYLRNSAALDDKGAAAPTRDLICSPDLGTPEKSNCFKPINTACAYLYPKFELVADSSVFDIVDHEGVDLANFVFDGLLADGSSNLMDLYAAQAVVGQPKYIDLCRENDLGGIYNDFDPNSEGFDSAPVFQKFGTKLPEIHIIVSPDTVLYTDSTEANCAALLGFPGESVLDPIQTAGFKTFTSVITPISIDGTSMFVRLTSTTQRSINGLTGNESKIVYHCPRFDTSGADRGQLFFEPNEKTYLDLENIQDIKVNSFSVDIVDRKEVPIEGLNGNTIAMFHIRRKKHLPNTSFDR